MNSEIKLLAQDFIQLDRARICFFGSVTSDSALGISIILRND